MNFLLSLKKFVTGDGFMVLLIMVCICANLLQCSATENERKEKESAQELVIKKEKQIEAFKKKQMEQQALLKIQEAEQNEQKKKLSEARKELNYLRKTNTELAKFLNTPLPDGYVELLPEAVQDK